MIALLLYVLANGRNHPKNAALMQFLQCHFDAEPSCRGLCHENATSFNSWMGLSLTSVRLLFRIVLAELVTRMMEMQLMALWSMI